MNPFQELEMSAGPLPTTKCGQLVNVPLNGTMCVCGWSSCPLMNIDSGSPLLQVRVMCCQSFEVVLLALTRRTCPRVLVKAASIAFVAEPKMAPARVANVKDGPGPPSLAVK